MRKQLTLPAPLGNIGISAVVLIAILVIARFARGFVAYISVLLGIIIGAVLATALGKMTFAKVGEAAWFDIITPFHFGTSPRTIRMIPPATQTKRLLMPVTPTRPTFWLNEV